MHVRVGQRIQRSPARREIVAGYRIGRRIGSVALIADGPRLTVHVDSDSRPAPSITPTCPTNAATGRPLPTSPVLSSAHYLH